MPQRIAVVEDSPEIAELYRDILADEGYEMIFFSEPIVDPCQLERMQPNLIILDWMFGRDCTGMHMLDLLGAYAPTSTIPVIVCTAALNAVAEVDCVLAARGVDVVLKPFSVDDFVSAIEQALAPRAPATIYPGNN